MIHLNILNTEHVINQINNVILITFKICNNSALLILFFNIIHLKHIYIYTNRTR